MQGDETCEAGEEDPDEREERGKEEQLYSTSKPFDHEPLEICDAPDPLAKSSVFFLNLSWFGLSVMFLVLSVVVVPAQIESMVGAQFKGRWLGGMVAGGAVCMFISGPLVGMSCDRITSRHGRRRPVMLASMIALCVGLVGMAIMAPHVTVRRVNGSVNGTLEDYYDKCRINLEEQRCRPYRDHNQSSITEVRLQSKLPQQGMALPEKKSQYDPEQQINTNEGNLGMFVVFYLILASSFTSLTVAYDALIADKSHPKQRGLSSGVMGFMILLGNISGATLGLFFVELGVLGIYACAMSLMVMCVMVTLVMVNEEPAKAINEPIYIKDVFIGFWAPLKDHDFRWVFITRFLMQQGVSTTTGFLEYWLNDMVHLPHCWTATRSVSMMLIPLLGTAAIGSIAFGIISDKIGRRKPMVATAAMVMCVVTVILAFTKGDYAYYVAIALTFFFGAGFGAYQAVDFALVLDVLPDEKDKAKDIACWHQALILPQALATPIGGILLDGFESIGCSMGLGYIVLFLVTAVYFFLSAVFVHKIKGVR